jgi:hypothetical protein
MKLTTKVLNLELTEDEARQIMKEIGETNNFDDDYKGVMLNNLFHMLNDYFCFN